mmetsp:Transcript_108941/g.307000  ORF Transcript_108941/g.307000 Transcript_108941/m.307000 type:complete len:494 (-) Transcript_108941:146-1627(-)
MALRCEAARRRNCFYSPARIRCGTAAFAALVPTRGVAAVFVGTAVALVAFSGSHATAAIAAWSSQLLAPRGPPRSTTCAISRVAAGCGASSLLGPPTGPVRSPRRGIHRRATEQESEDPPQGLPRVASAVSQRGPANSPPTFHNSWTDYTRYALGIEDYGPGSDPTTDQSSQGREKYEKRPIGYFVDRKRSMGVDFGPQFVGLALSLGGVNTIPMGTLETGEDWTELAVRIAQIASTRRVWDIVVGYPLEKSGEEGKIGRLVRYFTAMLADSVLLTLGPNTTVHLWDERFSTTYAAMRLVTKPKFDSAAFKSWLDGQRGLNFGSKALLDAEAARAILEHWLEKDYNTEVINKEKSERVTPSRQACMEYLRWRKTPLLQPRRPKEPAGPGKEAWEWDDAHPWQMDITAEEYMQQAEQFSHYMDGSDNFGDRQREYEKRQERREELTRIENERRMKMDLESAREKLRESGARVERKHKSLRHRDFTMKDGPLNKR